MDGFNDDRFSPLTESERAAGGTAKDEGECVMQVPPDAPDPPGAHPRLGKPSARWPYPDASGALLFEVWRFDPAGERKQFLPLSLWHEPSGRLAWRWKAVPEPRPLYGLDSLAAKPDAPVVVCEGEKAADTATRIFPGSVCVTSPGGSQSASKADWKPLARRHVLFWSDADEPGEKYAREVAAILHGLGCAISIIDAVALASIDPNGGPREPTKGWDAADAIAEWEDHAALRKAACGLAKPYEPDAFKPNGGASGASADDAEIARLAALRPADYDRARKDAAVKLGIRVLLLDKLVEAARPNDGLVAGQGRPLGFPEPEPWPEPVDGAALISAIAKAVKDYVVLSENEANTIALWVVHTFCFEIFQCSPRLAVTSPEKRCGKTTLLDVVGEMVNRPLLAANITAAAMFRTIELAKPTLLIDEADTFLRENEELRGVLNSGHRRGGQVIRTVGDDHEPRCFATYAPVAIALIGKLPDTLEDRSIHVSLRRRLASEPVTRFQLGSMDRLNALRRQAARWVIDNREALAEAEPSLPDSLVNAPPTIGVRCSRLPKHQVKIGRDMPQAPQALASILRMKLRELLCFATFKRRSPRLGDRAFQARTWLPRSTACRTGPGRKSIAERLSRQPGWRSD